MRGSLVAPIVGRMYTTDDTTDDTNARERLLAGIPVTERRLELAGVSTAVLEGGDGPPIVLLHGPGEFGAKWMRVIPDLVTSHRVVAPDLPAHGASEVPDGPLDADRVLAWLAELIERTCPSPPTLVGHVLGGAIAARFAADHGRPTQQAGAGGHAGARSISPGAEVRPHHGRLPGATHRGLVQPLHAAVLVRPGRPPRADGRALGPVRLIQPGPGPCAKREGRRPPDARARGAADPAGGSGANRRSHDPDLGTARPRNRPRVAEAASARYGWPLRVIEDCADDPPRDQPEAFLEALRD